MLKNFLNKKISIKLLFLIIYLCFLFTLFFGWAVKHTVMGGTRFGNFNTLIIDLASIPTNAKRFFEDKEHGLLIKDHNFDKVDKWIINNENYNNDENSGYLLISRFNGDLKRSVVELFDIKKNLVIHTWLPDIDKINKISKIEKKYLDLERDFNSTRYRIIHPLLLDDGSLIFQSNTPLIKINLCSKLEWAVDGIFHHSIEKGNDNTLWTSSRFRPSTVNIGESFKQSRESHYDDGIAQISYDGKVIFNKSVVQILIENELKHLIFPSGESWHFDPLHLNDVQPVLNDGKFWKKGDVFFSVKHINTIFLYRPKTNKIIWYKNGPWRHQHDVDILSYKEISIFDNNVNFDFSGVDGSNKIVIYDFENDTTRNYLMNALKTNKIETFAEGLHTILTNKDLMIEETEKGRLILFNKNGSRKWQYINKSSDNKVYRLNWSRFLDSKNYSDIIKNIKEKKNECL